MWLSADPAMGEYIPLAPIDDEAKQHNKELPGLGGVFNYVNLHVYHYAGNNPVVLKDPDGNTTEIDEATGQVMNIIYDGNCAIMAYQYNDGEKMNGPGNYVGATWFVDEFVDSETSKPFGLIQIGESFDPLIEEIHERASSMNLVKIAGESKDNRLFDIKESLGQVGRLLNGKYASSRSASNFLAGYNAQSGKIFRIGISFDKFQRLAGALHIKISNGKELSKFSMALIVLFGRAPGLGRSFKAPTYGEVPYQHRMSKMGWEYGRR
jgi:hypothetical protein